MPPTSSPHDSFVKRTFTNLDHAADELRAVLPPALVARIDWSTLRIEPGSFVDEALRDRHTDLLFSMRTFDGHDVRVHVLFEHQSRPDAWMPLRATEYIVRIWVDFRRKNPGATLLPIVVPVVLHHGEGGWTAPRTLHELVDPLVNEVPELRELVPNARLLIDDVAKLSDDAIVARSRATALHLALWLLRDARDRRALLASLMRWGPVLAELLARPGGLRASEYALRYLFQVAHEDVRVAFLELVDQTHPEAKEAVMTIEEMLLNRGRLEGEARGEARGEVRAAAKAVMRVLERRGIALSDADRAHIASCTHVEDLERMHDRALEATRASELFEH